jgi:hypothetical protein
MSQYTVEPQRVQNLSRIGESGGVSVFVCANEAARFGSASETRKSPPRETTWLSGYQHETWKTLPVRLWQ